MRWDCGFAEPLDNIWQGVEDIWNTFAEPFLQQKVKKKVSFAEPVEASAVHKEACKPAALKERLDLKWILGGDEGYCKKLQRSKRCKRAECRALKKQRPKGCKRGIICRKLKLKVARQLARGAAAFAKQKAAAFAKDLAAALQKTWQQPCRDAKDRRGGARLGRVARRPKRCKKKQRQQRCKKQPLEATLLWQPGDLKGGAPKQKPLTLWMQPKEEVVEAEEAGEEERA